jgi:hypothetical protein
MAPVCIRTDREEPAYSTEAALPVVTIFLTVLKGGGSAAWRKYTGRWEESVEAREEGTSVPVE